MKPKIMEKNNTLEDEQEVLMKMNGLVQSIQSNPEKMPLQMAYFIDQVTKNPYKQKKLVTDINNVLKLAIADLSLIINQPNKTVGQKEQSVANKLKDMNKEIYDIVYRAYDRPANKKYADIFSVPTAAGTAGIFFGSIATACGVTVLLAGSIATLVAGGACWAVLSVKADKIDSMKAGNYASIFTTKVAKELGISIKDFSVDGFDRSLRPRKVK